ncbi:hypothetical protein D3C87_1488360 [compost metagenome]
MLERAHPGLAAIVRAQVDIVEFHAADAGHAGPRGVVVRRNALAGTQDVQVKRVGLVRVLGDQVARLPLAGLWRRVIGFGPQFGACCQVFHLGQDIGQAGTGDAALVYDVPNGFNGVSDSCMALLCDGHDAINPCNRCF